MLAEVALGLAVVVLVRVYQWVSVVQESLGLKRCWNWLVLKVVV